jgi:PAS domain S-box-containing protein
MATLGEIVAANCTAALAFDDAEDAAEILSALQAETNIRAAILFDASGGIFSRYPENDSVGFHGPLSDSYGYHFAEGKLYLLQPVTQGSVTLGSLAIVANLQAVRDKLWLYAVMVFVVVVISLLLVTLLSRVLQRQISRPLITLAETARLIAEKKDYSERATGASNDELGTLADSFNQMLVQIEDRDRSLRRQKQQLEQIVESMGDAYVSLDHDWRYTFVNSRALSLMGKRLEDLSGRTLWEVFPDTVGSEFEVKYWSVMNERKPVSFEIHYDSYAMWLEIRAYPHEEGMAIFYTDITKYKKAEEEVRSFNKVLEQRVKKRTAALEAANAELESFSYSVSHDLSAPLRSVHGYMKIFSEDYASRLDGEANRLIGIIMDNAQKMGRLIDDLLEFSKLGRRELSRGMVPMKQMVDLICKDLLSAETDRHINVELQDIPNAFADTVTIRQVWINLLSNAIKYSRSKSESIITIGGQVQDQEVVYRVSDNGAGFDMRYYDKLFGVFHRLHRESEFEGTGVGLAIVQRIVGKHGGRIWAEGQVNHGATFWFSLPWRGDEPAG